MTYFKFPNHRFRRLRQQAWVRDLVQENYLRKSDLILPIFICDGMGIKNEIASMPGIYLHSIDQAIKTVQYAQNLGICMIMLFPNIEYEKKDLVGAEALNPDNLICRAIKAIKSAVPDIGIVADVALDAYTSHGHDGLFNADNTDIDNDKTIDILVQQSLLLAEAGVAGLAPSDMMDGRIGKIRNALEAVNFQNILLISYTAKYASALFAPYREAIGSKKAFGASHLKDKKTYQMNVANSKEALIEAEADIAEGADMLIVKPGMLYLDIVHQLSCSFDVPIIAYQVSGEYAMLKFAAMQGLLDPVSSMLEVMLSFKRAGARAIITYAAIEIAEMLNAVVP